MRVVLGLVGSTKTPGIRCTTKSFSILAIIGIDLGQRQKRTELISQAGLDTHTTHHRNQRRKKAIPFDRSIDHRIILSL